MTDVWYLREGWDHAARQNAMGNILSQKVDWDTEEFFERGRVEIEAVMARLAELGLAANRDHALDFGCGIGRCTQALADHYAQVHGVDVSPEMLKLARTHNRHGKRVRYRLNGPDLVMFPAGHFDLVYSMIVLQHMPVTMQERYVGEFIRVLAPEGAAVFEVPDCDDLSNGYLSMYGTKPEMVEDWVSAAGAKVVDREPINDGSYRYTAVRA